MRLTLCQLNPTVGDLEGNLERLKKESIANAGDSDLIIFPELYLTGYPPRDFLESSQFLADCGEAVRQAVDFSKQVPESGILFGAPRMGEDERLYNSAFLAIDGVLAAVIDKACLPVYDVFDEARYFTPGNVFEPVRFMDELLGITICEDVWSVPGSGYDAHPVATLAGKGASIIINLSASPYSVGIHAERLKVLRSHAKSHGLKVVYIDQVGGNDELVFDGTSMIINPGGTVNHVLASFQEQVATIDSREDGVVEDPVADDVEDIYRALVLGVKDYFRKCGFAKALIGLSGGIDSAVTCCIACEALGPDKVTCVSMPGPYSSASSGDDARELSDNLGVQMITIPITGLYESYLKSLGPFFEGMPFDAAEENIQARIRGDILMALSNKWGDLVLSTGNKSEMAVGYMTLYGDMSGGLAVLSDVPKTIVYKLAGLLNKGGEAIPASIISKPPSAELKPGQKDEDTLPPYDVLDAIISAYIDEGKSIGQISSEVGYDDLVSNVVCMINRNEYKRRQAPPGIRVTSKAFGMGRRMPVAAKYPR
ncbi:NAD+ synthase [Candidatus Altiarchaeota archaeon]